MRKIKKAVFPVGGLGTRFLPATKSVPKEMLPVAAKPLIQHAYEEALEAGIEQFIFITGRNKNAINNHFNHAYELQSILSEKDQKDMLSQVKDWLPSSGNVMFIPQNDALGLGHAVWCARNIIGEEPFAVLLADEMVLNKPGALKQMINAYNKHGGNFLAVSEVEKKDTYKYGIIDPEKNSKKQDSQVISLKGMVEKPDPKKAPSNLSITGRYILQPAIFKHLDKAIGNYQGDGEIQITDAMSKMLKTEKFYAYKFSGLRFDCGARLGFLEANIAYALEDKAMKKDIKKMLKKYV